MFNSAHEHAELWLLVSLSLSLETHFRDVSVFMFVCLVLRVRLIASSLFRGARVSGGEKHGRASDDYRCRVTANPAVSS